MTLTFMTAFSIQDISPFTQRKKFVQVTGALLHIGRFFRTFAPAIERKLLLYQMSVLIDDRRQSSMTTKRRARNEASGELKYQPSKHTKSMINYSITMRSVNSNLLIGSICHLLIVAYRPLLLYLRNPRAKPFLFGFYNQRFL